MRYVTLANDRKFPIHFSMYAIEQIQNRYESLDGLTAFAVDFKETIWVLTTLINEGIKLQNYESGLQQMPVNEEYIGLLLTPAVLSDNGVVQSIVDAMNDANGASGKKSVAQMMELGNQILGTMQKL